MLSIARLCDFFRANRQAAPKRGELGGNLYEELKHLNTSKREVTKGYVTQTT